MSKLNLINCIEISRQNKNNFNNTNDYNKILELLYQEIENKCIDSNLHKNDLNEIIKFNINFDDSDDYIDENEIYNDNYDDILNLNYIYSLNEFLNYKYKKILILKYPLLNIIYKENNKKYYKNIKYSLQINPIFGEYSKQKLINNVKFLLKLCDCIQYKKYKIVVCLVIFDYIFKNFNFVIEHLKFKETFENKLKEFYDFNHFNDVKTLLIEYNLDETIFEQWSEILNSVY